MEIRKLKKSLDTGLFVGKNVPKLIGSLGKSSKDLILLLKKMIYQQKELRILAYLNKYEL